jgi:FtsP/CotA-like multicopper oxidase with cupredoxin domain
MKLKTELTPDARQQLHNAWSTELDAARHARSMDDTPGEWAHLQRAHILSQPLAGSHVRTHAAMFASALRRRDLHEILGQAFRLIVAGPGSLTGRYPVGNTGGADVNAFRPMEIPDDLRVYLDVTRGAIVNGATPESVDSAATFSTEITGLRDSTPPEVVELADHDTLRLTIGPVVKDVAGNRVRMLSYNGSIPGPTLRVQQGSEITVVTHNDGDVEATVHWHGLRLENQYDGVPYETQDPIPIGGEYTCRLRFPDPGLYWYHPHIREDYGLAMGLYGNIVVVPSESDYWAPVNREAVVTLADVLIEDGHIATFRRSGPTFVAMGRFGNTMLTSGETAFELRVHTREVVRFYFTNTANTRLFNVAIPGARMKLVGGDSGRYEHETFVEEVLLAPSERAIVDVLFDEPGPQTLEHRTPDHTYELGTILVADEVANPSYVDDFERLRDSEELTARRAGLRADLERPADKTLAFKSLMPLLYGDTPTQATSWQCPMHPDVTSSEPGTCPQCGMKLVAVTVPVSYACPMHPDVMSSEPGTCPQCGMKLVAQGETLPNDAARLEGDAQPHSHAHDTPDGLEWEDLMPEINAASDATNMIWKLVDLDSGKQNWEIDWAFHVGDQVKIRLVNDMDQDHPMHHPFHIHGAGRFLVLSRNDIVEPNLAWKDTVLVRSGESVDILLDVTNPGLWMAHCHIAEHNQSGMMFSFPVA